MGTVGARGVLEAVLSGLLCCLCCECGGLFVSGSVVLDGSFLTGGGLLRRRKKLTLDEIPLLDFGVAAGGVVIEVFLIVLVFAVVVGEEGRCMLFVAFARFYFLAVLHFIYPIYLITIQYTY